ncbi:hypothetical protein AB9P05_03625 [Roseivirga sp. BDSF3-8]|uniref:hypothetical protein n=1 Tax=Roseivirga sp. BDSF3-8 TaxID=3241598 RepID=UPI0035325EB0
MNRINKYLFFMLAAGFTTFTACQNEDEFPVPELDTVEEGIIPRVSIVEGNLGLINPNDFDNTDVEFTVDAYSDGYVNIDEVEIYLTYNGFYITEDQNGEDSVVEFSERRLYTTIQSVPSNVSFGTAEIESLFGVDRDTLDVGESFLVDYTYITESGKRIDQWSADICNESAYNGTCSFSVGVFCPTEIPAGNYTVTAYRNQNIADPRVYTVSITQGSGTTFDSPNLNLDYQTPFYSTFEGLPISGGFTDVCNTVTLDQPGEFGVIWSGEGTFDPVNNTITFPQISDPGYGQGPWTNAGQGYVLTYTGN